MARSSSSSALLYDRYATSQINAYGGLAAKLPRTATLFVLTTLAMIGLPMLSGFVGEFLILSSTFGSVSHGWAIAATLGVILGAAYMLWLVQRLFYGPQSEMVAASPPPISTSANSPALPIARSHAGHGRCALHLAAPIEQGVHPPPQTAASPSS